MLEESGENDRERVEFSRLHRDSIEHVQHGTSHEYTERGPRASRGRERGDVRKPERGKSVEKFDFGVVRGERRETPDVRVHRANFRQRVRRLRVARRLAPGRPGHGRVGRSRKIMFRTRREREVARCILTTDVEMRIHLKLS